MKKFIYLVLTVSFSLLSCTKETKKETAIIAMATSNTPTEKEGYTLLKSKCYACHSVTTKSHDEIIAPPMVAVKRHYTNKYDNKKDFVNAIVNFATDPKEEKTLMFGAVNRFKVMPNMGFAKADVEKIATYIYENEVETPAWFQGHQKGMGKMKGKSCGKSMKGCGKGDKGCGKSCGKSCKG